MVPRPPESSQAFRLRSTLAIVLATVVGFGASAPCPAFQAVSVVAPAAGRTLEAPPDTGVLTLPGPAAAATLPDSRPIWNPLPDTSRPAGAPSHGLMWKASSATNTVYLLGSIHLASRDIYPLPRQIEEAFRNSAVLLVEVDLNKVDQRKLQALLISNGLYPPGDSLWNHIGQDTKELVMRFCAENGLSADVFARLKPWLASVTASALPMQMAGMEAGLGIDKHFLDLANGGMRVEQLETAEWQLRLLADIPEVKQEQYLATTIKSTELTKQLGQQVEAAWVNGDAHKLDALLSSAYQDAADLAKRVFTDRNLHMAGVVEQYLKGNERCFVVVGAGHLVGKEGVVRLLQNRGVKVEQVFSRN